MSSLWFGSSERKSFVKADTPSLFGWLTYASSIVSSACIYGFGLLGVPCMRPPVFFPYAIVVVC